MSKPNKFGKSYKPRTMSDLIGKTINSLYVETTDPRPDHRGYFLCRCECGNYCSVEGSNIIRHNTTSCGCKKHAELSTRIGKPKSKYSLIGKSFEDYIVIGHVKTATPRYIKYL